MNIVYVFISGVSCSERVKLSDSASLLPKSKAQKLTALKSSLVRLAENELLFTSVIEIKFQDKTFTNQVVKLSKGEKLDKFDDPFQIFREKSEMHDLIRSLSVISKTHVGFVGMTIKETEYGVYLSRSEYSYENKSIDTALARCFRKFYANYTALTPEIKLPMDIALYKFSSAASFNNRKHIFERVIDLSVAAEMIFASDATSEVTYRLSSRMAKLSSPNEELRKERIRSIKSFYTLRSGVVHGDHKVWTFKDKNAKKAHGLIYEFVEIFSDAVITRVHKPVPWIEFDLS